MKKINIAISSLVGFSNKGSEALLKTRIEAINKYFNNEGNYVVFTIYTESCNPIENTSFIKTYGGDSTKFRSFKYLIISAIFFIGTTISLLLFKYFRIKTTQLVKKLSNIDIFISTDGDVLGEDYGLLPFIWRSYFLFFTAFSLNKPVFIYSEGLGPFNSYIGRKIAKYCFTKCKYISVRDAVSKKYIQDLTNRPVELVSDSAFNLGLIKPKSKFRLPSNKNIVTVAVSKLATTYIKNSRNDPYILFVKSLSSFIDSLIVEKNSFIVFVPHVNQINRNDYSTALEILKYVKNKKNCIIANENMSAEEYKYIISRSNILIASRMHAIIAALSTYTPVCAISYSHKTLALMKRLGLSKYVFYIEDFDKEIYKKYNSLDADKQKVIKKLKKKIPMLKKKAYIPAKRIHEWWAVRDLNS